jgi:hypothetical protein
MSRTRHKDKTRCKDTVNAYPNHNDSCGVCQHLDAFNKKQNRAYKHRKQELKSGKAEE